MARKCTCKICKTKGDTDTFHKVTDEKGRNSYYCNQEEYENFINEKNKRKSLLEYIALEVLNYDEGQIIHPIMIKKINEIHKFYDYEVIQECFKENKDTIQYWIKEKNFTNEYNMVSYVMKIIEGNINDAYNKWKHMKKQMEKLKQDNVNLDTLNEIENNNINIVKKKDSILAFLDEGDM